LEFDRQIEGGGPEGDNQDWDTSSSLLTATTRGSLIAKIGGGPSPCAANSKDPERDLPSDFVLLLQEHLSHQENEVSMVSKYLLALSLGVLFPVHGAFGQTCDAEETVTSTHISRSVQKNYIEIVYDAKKGTVQWRQHPDQGKKKPTDTTTISIPQTALFPPFTDTKQRILVKVCNLKFDTDISATTAVTNIPESGPDIHGLEQASTAATPQVGTQQQSIVSLFAAETTTEAAPKTDLPATLSTPRGVELVGLQLKSLMAAYRLDYVPLADSIPTFLCRAVAQDAVCDVGTVHYIIRTALALGEEVKARRSATDGFTNQGAFEVLATKTQNLVSSLNNLQGALQSADLVTKLGKVLADDQSLGTQLVSVEKVLSDEQAAFDKAQQKLQAAQQNLAAAQTALAQAAARDKASKQQDVDSRTDELKTAQKTLDDETPIHNRYAPLKTLTDQLENERNSLHPFQLVNDVVTLNNQVTDLHHDASDVFKQMNDLRERSSVVMAKVIDPVTTNSVISVAIILHDSFVPFDFAPAKATSSDNSGSPSAAAAAQQNNQTTGKGTTPSKSTSPSSSPPGGTEQHVVRTVLVEVHRISDFNIVSGFAASSIRNPAYGLRAVSSTNTNLVAFQSQNDRLQGQYLIGINAYLCKRDMFPGYLTPKMRLTPGVLVGTSVTTSKVNFVAGLDFELFNGVDLYGGLIVGDQTELGSGIVLGVTQFPPGTTSVPTTQRLAAGAFFGVGLDAHVFKSIFKTPF
jgi:hypothetical protein